ncbi:hypothetical protein CRM22_002814 [Opisthorchis felineus]|uniref:Uncharacterized protein n=1 Tax=Opisthorchis felineus TaxID=147828 RepID=A0A4S2M8R9_OPIFE|nr:hypothetical protein CRM22_002814 [Opisthorchis felineus]
MLSVEPYFTPVGIESQPTDLVDEIIWTTVDQAWNNIQKNLKVIQTHAAPETDLSDSVKTLPSVEQIHLYSVTSLGILLSRQNRLTLFELNGSELLDEWSAGSCRIRTMLTSQISEEVVFVLVIDDIGKAYYLLVTSLRKLIFLQSVETSDGSRDFHVLGGKLVAGRSVCSIVFQDAQTQETWIEVYRLPIDGWVKEIETKMEQEKDESDLEHSMPGADEAKQSYLSQAILVCKIGPPSRLTGSTIKSLPATLTQMAEKPMRRTPIPTNTFATGSHLFSESMLECRRREFVQTRGYPDCLLHQTKQHIVQVESDQPEVATMNQPVEDKNEQAHESQPNSHRSMAAVVSDSKSREGNREFPETKAKKDYIKELLDDACSRKMLGYPRYEFLVEVNTAEDHKKQGTKSVSLTPGVHGLCAYWSNSTCLSFYTFNKLGKSAEATVEECRIFSAPIASLQVSMLQSPHCSSEDLLEKTKAHTPNYCLLIGLINGNIIVRDLQTGSYILTTNAWNGPITQLGTYCNVTMYALVLRQSRDMGRLSDVITVCRKSWNNVSTAPLAPEENFKAVSLLELHGSLKFVAALKTDGELLLFHVEEVTEDIHDSVPMRVRLPYPYTINIHSGTVGLLSKNPFAEANEELANQLQLSFSSLAEEENHNMLLWIRGVRRDNSGTVEKIFYVTLPSRCSIDRQVAQQSNSRIGGTFEKTGFTSSVLSDITTFLVSRNRLREERTRELQKLWEDLPECISDK